MDCFLLTLHAVTPAKAGAYGGHDFNCGSYRTGTWVPAFAGMTE